MRRTIDSGAAERAGIPPETFRVWLKRGFLDELASVLPEEGGSTAGDVVALRLVREFARFVTVPEAVGLAVGCWARVRQFLFEGKQEFRFVGLRIVPAGKGSRFEAHCDGSLAGFAREGAAAYFAVDLAGKGLFPAGGEGGDEVAAGAEVPDPGR